MCAFDEILPSLVTQKLEHKVRILCVWEVNSKDDCVLVLNFSESRVG